MRNPLSWYLVTIACAIIGLIYDYDWVSVCAVLLLASGAFISHITLLGLEEQIKKHTEIPPTPPGRGGSSYADYD